MPFRSPKIKRWFRYVSLKAGSKLLTPAGFFALIALCAISFGILYFLTHFIAGKKANEAGDATGVVNGLFSALAFAGVIYAIFLQRQELMLQRRELKFTRHELQAQKEEFQVQNITLKRQRFESTFFNMMQLQQQIVSGLELRYKTYEYNPDWHGDLTAFNHIVEHHVTGREVFKTAYLNLPMKTESGNTTRGMRGIIRAFGCRGYEESDLPTIFDHYFRHLYRMVKFVKESDLIEDEDRYDYVAMIRSQLSKYELVWLYYNALSCYGREKFKPMIEDYALLKNLRMDCLARLQDGDDSFGEYEQGAFGR